MNDPLVSLPLSDLQMLLEACKAVPELARQVSELNGRVEALRGLYRDCVNRIGDLMQYL